MECLRLPLSGEVDCQRQDGGVVRSLPPAFALQMPFPINQREARVQCRSGKAEKSTPFGVLFAFLEKRENILAKFTAGCAVFVPCAEDFFLLRGGVHGLLQAVGGGGTGHMAQQ